MLLQVGLAQRSKEGIVLFVQRFAQAIVGIGIFLFFAGYVELAQYLEDFSEQIGVLIDAIQSITLLSFFHA